MISFFVHGIPAPKGSRRNYAIKTTSGKIVVGSKESNEERVRPWMASVADACVQRLDARRKWPNPQAIDGLPVTMPIAAEMPIELNVHFNLPRPKSHRTAKGKPTKQYRAHPTTKPDLDKLVRAVKDALTGVLWQDDSQVVVLNASKRYVIENDRPGVSVAVEIAH